jgi:beta-galactosidase
MLGVCYYPEHWPERQWPVDARNMAELGLRWVRIGEFAWSRIEPERDRFVWDWLDRAIEILGNAGLQVVMCTPTATPPKWLVDEHPDILAWTADGRPRCFGSRRHSCFSSPTWWRESRRIVELVARRYGDNPAVRAWQLDNEYGCHDTVMSWAPHCRPAFQDWLRRRYGAIEALNTAWGTVFWSQEYRDFSEIDFPGQAVTESNPAHRLDFRRFSSDQVAAYNRMQAGIVRAHAPERPITHNFMGFFREFDHYPVAADLDVAAWDSYPLGFTERDMNLAPETLAALAQTGHPDTAAFHHDLYRPMAPAMWVMEQQPGPVNWAPHNPAPAPGMVRLWTLEALAHGAQVVSYFRWRQYPRAQEQLHTGLRRPDDSPDAAYEEVQAVARALRELGPEWPAPAAAGARAPVALLMDYEAAWALDIQPHGATFSYPELVLRWYTALRRLGLDVDVVSPRAPLTGYRLVAAPSLPLLDAGLVRHLADSGASIVLGPRSGSRQPDFSIPEGLPPGPLREHLPLRVERVESLPPGVSDTVLWNDQQYPVTRWRESLRTDRAAEGSFASGLPAVVRHERFCYVGFWPDDDFLLNFFEGELTRLGIAVLRLPEGLRVRRLGPLCFAFNYGPDPARAPAPEACRFLLGGRTIPPRDLTVWLPTAPLPTARVVTASDAPR